MESMGYLSEKGDETEKTRIKNHPGNVFYFTTIIIFVTGIWIGKMMVLRLYIQLSNKILSKSQVLSNNINRIIGGILFTIALIQLIR